MVPFSTEVTVGSRLSLAIEILDATDVGSVPFHVVFNPAVLRFENGREGHFLSRGGRQTAFFAAPMSNGSEAVVGLSRLGRGEGIGGGGDLCTLYFSVVGPGDTGLGFIRAHVRDSQNRIVKAIFEPATVSAR